MSRTAYFWTPESLMHDNGRHVENMERAKRLAPERILPQVESLRHMEITAHDAGEWVLKVHEESHHRFVREACADGRCILDGGDTLAGPGSYEAALAAVDGALSAADAVVNGEALNAFCAARPPGHHALPFQSMGFCLFATASILVRYLQEKHGLQRIAVVDWDVHHGNGTQHIFWRDSDVFFVSLHQHPHYPGTGLAGETGEGAGEGTTLNIPVAAGTPEESYLAKFQESVIPAIEAHGPEALVVSAGFDAHRDDPLGGLMITEAGFARMTGWLKALAESLCKGHLICLLEGGYNLDALERSVVAHLRELSA
ncbi:MAG: histone deacetylase [Nitrospinae bacterium]|nr:histone deacetylase [Nitrospinota bacterium]